MGILMVHMGITMAINCTLQHMSTLVGAGGKGVLTVDAYSQSSRDSILSK